MWRACWTLSLVPRFGPTATTNSCALPPPPSRLRLPSPSPFSTLSLFSPSWRVAYILLSLLLATTHYLTRGSQFGVTTNPFSPAGHHSCQVDDQWCDRADIDDFDDGVRSCPCHAHTTHSLTFTQIGFSSPCPIGMYKAHAGADMCLFCPVGTYQNATGATFCYPCPPKSYCPLGTPPRLMSMLCFLSALCLPSSVVVLSLLPAHCALVVQAQ